MKCPFDLHAKNEEPVDNRVVPLLKIQPHYLNQIRSGAKTVEGRVSTQTLRNLRVGQVLKLESSTQSISSGRGEAEVEKAENVLFVKITQKRHFDSFGLMLTEMGLTTCLPDFRNRSIDEGEAEYHRLIPFAWARVNKKRDGGVNGVDAFGVEVVSNGV